MRKAALVFIALVGAAGCGSDATDTCTGAPSTCPGSTRTYELCAHGGACYFNTSDGTTFSCVSCGNCNDATLKVSQWCTGGTIMTGMSGISLAVTSYQQSSTALSVGLTIGNQSHTDAVLTAAPLFSVQTDAATIISGALPGPAPACDGNTQLAVGGMLSCNLVLNSFPAARKPTLLLYQDVSGDKVQAAFPAGFCVQEPETSSVACSDGCDNDGNGFTDCDDKQCCLMRSDCAAGTLCYKQQHCALGPENTFLACADGCDNDQDGFVDCDDRDCCPFASGCAPTTYCGSH